MIDRSFWQGRRVFLTGHTGFKGAWMSLVLSQLGAEVHGFALPANPKGIFEAARVEELVHHEIGDIREFDALRSALNRAQPDVVIHMAAQALVRLSYAEPVETYATNVMGTVHLLEALRQVGSVRAAIIVTSDKCYENDGSAQPFHETDRMGGRDVYSNSKGCAELVTAAYRDSFFGRPGATPIASARAGNVIGGGDWSQDRLVPDAVRAFTAHEPLQIRNPAAIRPWQHVLDPVLGYLLLAERLAKSGAAFAEGWNFGPSEASEVPVRYIVDELTALWGAPARWVNDNAQSVAEAAYLKLDCRKAMQRLSWQPLLQLDEALASTIAWYKAARVREDMRDFSMAQIKTTLEIN